MIGRIHARCAGCIAKNWYNQSMIRLLPTLRTREPVGFFRLVLLGTLVLAGLAACQTSANTATVTPSVQPSPTPTATPEPLGSLSNPILIAVVPGPDAPAVEDPAGQVGAQLTDRTGLSIRVNLYPDYATVLDDLTTGRVHAAWLPPLTYLYAKSQGLARVEYLTSHFGMYQYGFQILVNAESGFSLYFDPESGTNIVDDATALAQFVERRPCYTDADAISGAIAPAGLLNRNGVAVLEPVFTRGYTSTVRALYIRGVCDFGATFALSGDPRTSPSVMNDLPDAAKHVVIAWRSDAIIPNLNFSTAAHLPDELRARLNQALLDLSQSPEGPDLLTQLLEYSVEDLKPADDAAYQALGDLVQSSGVNLADHIGY